jgi:hypothetical protein
VAIVKGSDVIDSYQQVLPAAASFADEYIKGIRRSIENQQLPVEITTETASTGLFKAVMGRRREFLVVKPTNRALDVFRILHYGVPSGNNLAAGWFLTGRVRGLGTTQFRVPVIDALDIFDNADLQALVDGIHHFAVIESIMGFADQVGFSRDRVETKHQGFFGVS